MGDDSIGRTLKKAREEKNLSLDEASRATKIRKEFLIAIEEDRHEALPGNVFTRGFIRSYGDFLGIDGKTAAVRVTAGTVTELLVEPPNAVRPAAGPARWMVLAAALTALLAVVAYFGFPGLTS